MIEMKFTGNTYHEILTDLLTVVPASPPTTFENLVKGVSLEELKEVFTKRFADNGILVTFSEQQASAPGPSSIDIEPEWTNVPPPVKNKGGRPRKNPTVVQDQKAAVAALQNGNDVGPDADRAYVFEQMHKLYDDANRTEAVKAFATRMAKQFKVERISLTETSNFPVIRAELEKEFKLAH